jgi:predicted NAD/FAD-dependent oxidoreductase
MINPNHRYALDGRDLASYGGLLLCLGQFDRPHPPPQPVFDIVRTRSTKEHANRTELDKYMATNTNVDPASIRSVAVIGAGISGLICARTLQDHGLDVTVFEKSRGPGGRTATRRADPDLSYDHGAQYFTARDPHFARYVDAWIEQGIVSEWNARIVEIEGSEVRPKTDQPRRYVGVPGMKAMAQHLATDIELRRETRIVGLTRTSNRWELTVAGSHEHQSFDNVVVALPSPQAVDLLGEHPFATEVREVRMTPCWTVLAAFERQIDVPWDGAFVHDSPLGWVARNSSKPGRDPSVDCWVLQATPDWSTTHLELARPDVTAMLLAQFAKIISDPEPSPIHLDAHLWRFSATPQNLDRASLFDPTTGIAVCGDWLAGGRVEGAFRSGVAAAGYILREASIPPERTR